MNNQQLHSYLDNPAEADGWVRAWGVENLPRAHANLVNLATAGITLDLLALLCGRLAELLPRLSDPDMALNNLDRYVQASRNPLALGGLFERDPEALAILLQIFSTSQHLSDLLIGDPESFDLLRLTEGQPVERAVLVGELTSEVSALNDEAAVMKALRLFKRRETLRICYGDIIRGQSLEVVTEQISFLADAIVEAAIAYARRRLAATRGVPRQPDGKPAQFVALGMGKLGGVELNYSSDIDLILLYDGDGSTDGARSVTNREFFERLARDMVRLLTEPTELGQAYRVDLRLRPDGQRGALVHSVEQALHYYDVLGRTWERQAYVKARPVAGDLDLGQRVLEHLQPWIYRRYLNRADITGIKALKRRIEQRSTREGTELRNVKTGRGGIRDIEFVIQFLQLLNGGDLPELRTGNTLEAIARLGGVGCLTHQERALLAENYAFLRKIEHRLQIMFDLQTHTLPEGPDELRKLALRLGYADTGERAALAAFQADYESKTALNRKILDHLLHDAFGPDEDVEPEVDLVLDPDPPREQIAEVLGRYPFQDVNRAYENLMALSRERIRFLSTRRCRHFLAAIAPRLLAAIAATPDPDSTLVNLEKVSDSLGGKGVLWELFSSSPPSMNLYVELCGSSPFLSGLLITNPGMLDELMDSLVLNKLPTLADLRATLDEQARGAEDLVPILHSFKNTQQLQVGVRDVLNKEDIEVTLGTLANIAQVCLDRIARDEYEKLLPKYGEPTNAAEGEPSRPCGWVMLALGKLGGCDLNYHSDVDLVFLYEGDGNTARSRRSGRGETTTNQHFFSELGQRIVKAASQLGPQGRIYPVDLRLRPTGKSGPMATTLAEFVRYFADGQGQLWERQALCKARVIGGSEGLAAPAREAIAAAMYCRPWQSADAAAIRDMRARIEADRPITNLKRGPGGATDVEFLVQMLVLKHGAERPELRVQNTFEALETLHKVGLLSTADYVLLNDSYRFLRVVHSRLRLTSAVARDILPDDRLDLAKLARSLGFADGAALVAECTRHSLAIRERFDAVFAAEAPEAAAVGEV